MRTLLPSALLGLLFTVPAIAAPTSYTPTWSDTTSGGSTIGGVTVTTTLYGAATMHSSPSGPWIGRSDATSDAKLTFSKPIYEFCVYIWYNNTGESFTLTTNGTGTDSARKVDSGGVTTTIVGTTFTWSAMATSDEALACVGNPDGFTEITYDHNGMGNGLAIGDSVVMDLAKPVCTPTTWYLDDDGDGVGGSVTTSACSAPADYVASTGDCDDAAVGVYPGATEIVGNGIDESCDGKELCYVDGDGDGWRTSDTVVSADADCTDAGEAAATVSAGDCDDAAAGTYPGATEVVGNGVDESCDGEELCYVDGDGDGWRTGDTVVSADVDCTDVGEAGASVSGGDCDDAASDIYPGATEVVGNGVDESCDGKEVCYADADGDGWRTSATVVSDDVDCDDSGEAGAGVSMGDCDDAAAGTYPGSVEIPYDGVDQDCSGADLCDVDGDGYDDPRCGGMDCADDVVAVHPGALEVWYDGVDQDCDGWSDHDADMDGFDVDEDCDDADHTRNSDAEEIWYDGVDQDCSGGSDADQDGDGFDASTHGGTDCDDLSDLTYPGAPELDDGLDNDCNGMAEDSDVDEDGIADELELELGLDPDTDDSDGDGVLDRDELGDVEDPWDTDGDGIIDALDDDDDDDGIPSEVEVLQSLKTIDSDADGTPDHLDLDSDDDGYDDIEEGDVDSDFDGVPDYLDVDSDEDGVNDADEVDGDSDGDGVEDRLDVDDDGDGLATSEEGSWSSDIDGDGVPNYLDDDSDGDGIADADELWSDSDCNGVLDATEAESGESCVGNEVVSFGSGCSATSGPAGLGGLMLGLFALLGMRRRNS